MDIDFSSWIMILVPLFIFLAVLLKLAKPVSDPNRNLPPGPRKLPLIGNLHLLLGTQPLHRILTNLAKKHGPVMHLQLGEISTVVVSSPEVAKEILRTHDITFANRPSLFSTEVYCYNNTDIGFAPYGEYWRQLRKICTIELLSAKRVESFRPVREEEFLNLCRWIASKEGSSINLTEKIALTTCDIIMRESLGKMTDELTAFISVVKECVKLGAGFHISDLYPSIGWLRAIGGYAGKVEKLHRLSDGIVDNIIKKHREASHESKQHEDLVDVLLKFNDAGHELHLTNENVKAVLQDMFNAGIETSSTTADWAMAEMLSHPRVLKKAQDEVRMVFNEQGFVDESDFEELKYLKLVIKETLRMHPPLPLLLPRENYEPCEISGYKLPAKTRVFVNAWAMARDPKNWKDADSFIPERHLDVSVDYKGNNFEYLPFGGGRRVCPGMTLGLANVELPLALLLYHFDWVLPDGINPENLDMTELFGMTVCRKKPLHVIPVVKNPLPVN